MRRAALLVLVVVPLAACGGGGGTRLSRDDYVTKADAVCGEVDALQRTLKAPATLAEIPAYVDKAIPILDTGVTELRALRPPKELEQGVDDWLKTTDETRGLLKQLKKDAEANDSAAVAADGSKGQEIDARRDAKARALGLTTCANTH